MSKLIIILIFLIIITGMLLIMAIFNIPVRECGDLCENYTAYQLIKNNKWNFNDTCICYNPPDKILIQKLR